MESGSDASDDGSEEDESDGEDWDAMEEKLRRGYFLSFYIYIK